MPYFSVISNPLTGSTERIQDFLNLIFCFKEIFNENVRVSALQRNLSVNTLPCGYSGPLVLARPINVHSYIDTPHRLNFKSGMGNWTQAHNYRS